MLSADLEGLPWLSRVARGLHAALQLAKDPVQWRVDAGAELLEDCERDGDQWTLCVLGTVLGAAYAFAGHDEHAIAPLSRAEEVAGELGAPVLQIWATAFRVAVQIRNGDAQAQADADQVVRWARALGAVGAARLLDPGGLGPGHCAAGGCGRSRFKRRCRPLGRQVRAPGPAALPGRFRPARR